MPREEFFDAIRVIRIARQVSIDIVQVLRDIAIIPQYCKYMALQPYNTAARIARAAATTKCVWTIFNSAIEKIDCKFYQKLLRLPHAWFLSILYCGIHPFKELQKQKFLIQK